MFFARTQTGQPVEHQAAITSIWITEGDVAFAGNNISAFILKYERLRPVNSHAPAPAGQAVRARQQRAEDLITTNRCHPHEASWGHTNATTPTFDRLVTASARRIGREMMSRWSMRLLELSMWANRAGIHAWSELATCSLVNVAGLHAGVLRREDVAVIDVGTGSKGRALIKQCNSKRAFDVYAAAFPGGGLNKLYHPIKF